MTQTQKSIRDLEAMLTAVEQSEKELSAARDVIDRRGNTQASVYDHLNAAIDECSRLRSEYSNMLEDLGVRVTWTDGGHTSRVLDEGPKQ